MRTLTYRDREKRLAQLEQQSERQAEATGPLTDNDCRILAVQHSLGNIAMTDGVAARRWSMGGGDYAQALDTALARLNAAIAQTPWTVQAMCDQLASQPHWDGCVFCGNRNDAHQKPCPWCGVINGGYFPPNWTHTPTVCVCPRCTDRHELTARQPSDWNRIGACPVCQYAPPPNQGQAYERVEAWSVAMGFTGLELAMKARPKE